MRKSHLELYMSLSEELGYLSFLGLDMEARLSLFRAHLRQMLNAIAGMAGRPAYGGKGDFWLRHTDAAKEFGPAGAMALQIPQEGHDLFTILGYYDSGRRTYKIAEEFGRELARANLDLPVSVIPRREETVLIEFPDWAAGSFKNPDGTFSLACYIRQEVVPLLDGAPGRLLRLQFPDYDEKGGLSGGSSYLNVRLDGDGDIDRLIAMAEAHTGQSVFVAREAIRYAVASYVYVSSGDPDLRHLKPKPLPTTRKEKKLRQFIRETANESLVDLTLVGYDFKKAKTYHVDETSVRGHLRLQPWGEGRTQVRVIWIEPHVRRYQKDTAAETEVELPQAQKV